MDDERFAAIEIGQDIFRAAIQALHKPPGQALGEIARERHAQIAAPRHHFGESVALEHGLKAHSLGFDFGQFGHLDVL